jgi:hypothetical protein
MADFARCSAAAVPAFGWTADAFLEAYRANIADADAGALEASLVAALLPPAPWTGTATDLLASVALRASEQTLKHKYWPKDGRALANHLRTIVGNLRSVEIDVQFTRSHGKREIVISKCGAEGEIL